MPDVETVRISFQRGRVPVGTMTFMANMTSGSYVYSTYTYSRCFVFFLSNKTDIYLDLES